MWDDVASGIMRASPRGHAVRTGISEVRALGGATKGAGLGIGGGALGLRGGGSAEQDRRGPGP